MTITLRLSGGFGNQAFQLGAALNILSLSDCKKLVLVTDGLSSYETKRGFALSEVFSLDPDHITVEKASLISKLRLPKIMQKLRRSHPALVSDNNYSSLYFSGRRLNSPPSHIVMDGYFNLSLNQSAFDASISQLQAIYKFKSLFNLQERVCCHIRGGDIVERGLNAHCGVPYYVDSLKFIFQRFGSSFPVFVITDDPLYAKSMTNSVEQELKLKENSITIIENSTMSSDICFMASSRFKILANSTFSLLSANMIHIENGLTFSPRLYPSRRKIWSRRFVLHNEASL